MAELQREISSFHRRCERLIVFAFHAQAAALPEIGDREQFLIIRLLFETEDKFEVLNGFVRGLLRHRHHAFCHAQMQVVMQRQVCAHSTREFPDDFLDQSWPLKSHVHPLGQIAGE